MLLLVFYSIKFSIDSLLSRLFLLSITLIMLLSFFFTQFLLFQISSISPAISSAILLFLPPLPKDQQLLFLHFLMILSLLILSLRRAFKAQFFIASTAYAIAAAAAAARTAAHKINRICHQEPR